MRRTLAGEALALPRALRQSPVTIVAVLVIVFWLLAALLAPVIAPYPPLEQDVMSRLAPPARHTGSGQIRLDATS